MNGLLALLIGAVALGLSFLFRRVASPPVLPPDATVEELLSQGRSIDAIRRHPELHGVGLREAKEAIERIARSIT